METQSSFTIASLDVTVDTEKGEVLGVETAERVLRT